MRSVSVEAFEDRERPAGGYAVICLHDVAAFSEQSTFILRPVDIAEGSADYERWPHGAQTPVETRQTARGVELIVGPDLVDNPMLLPGAVVRIDVPEEQVTGEFLWPTVAPLVRPRRKSVLAGSRSAERSTAADRSAKPATPRVADRATRAAEPEAGDMVAPVTVAPPAMFETSAGAADDVVAKPSPADAGEKSAARTFYQWARRMNADGFETPSVATPQRPWTDFLPRSRAGAVVAAIAGLLAFEALTALVLWPRQPAEIAIPPAQEVHAEPAPGLPLYDAFSVGATSPRGRSAASIGPERALEIANASLFAAGGTRDTDEAAFWLKRYLANAVGDERTRRVLTQLGTTFASPSQGPASYATAQSLWEIAAAYGDTQAMCFLAVYFERGFGGPERQADGALWRQRAKPSGGCTAQKAP